MRLVVIILSLFTLLPFYSLAQNGEYKEVNPNGNKGGFSLVDKWAMYPNGTEGIAKHIETTMKYPDEAKKENIEGKVIVSYVVQKDGTIDEIKVIQKAHPLLDEEAKRVILKMEKWKPSIQKGKPIKTAYQQTFNFTL